MKTPFVIDDGSKPCSDVINKVGRSCTRPSSDHHSNTLILPTKQVFVRVSPNDKRERLSELTSLSHDLSWTLLMYTAMSTGQTIAHFQKDM